MSRRKSITRYFRLCRPPRCRTAILPAELRPARFLAVLLVLGLAATACGDDDSGGTFSAEEAWCIGLVDGIVASAGAEIDEGTLTTTLGDCAAEGIPTATGGFETPFLLLAEADTPDDAYCRGRVAGDLALMFGTADAQLDALDLCLQSKPLDRSEGLDRARRVFGR